MSRIHSRPVTVGPSAPGFAGRRVFSILVLAASASALWAEACGASLASAVQTEAAEWGAFHHVLGGDLVAGRSSLPAPVREGHCYRAIFATEGDRVPSLAFQGTMDSESVGFPIRAIEGRASPGGSARVTVYGFCSQGQGTVQLVVTMPVAGHGGLYEAPFSALGPMHGPDVSEAQTWLVAREQQLAERQARRTREEEQAAVQQFADSVRGELGTFMDSLVEARGRYRDVVFDEIRGGVDTSESLVLEPGRCYLFAVVPHGMTALEVDVQFARIRNAATRSDDGGGVTYSVCTAPSGPVQEVTFSVRPSAAGGGGPPPVYAVRVAHRTPSSAERREADDEWLRNDPEAQAE